MSRTLTFLNYVTMSCAVSIFHNVTMLQGEISLNYATIIKQYNMKQTVIITLYGLSLISR